MRTGKSGIQGNLIDLQAGELVLEIVFE